MSALDRASEPQESPAGTLVELFFSAVEKHGGGLAYRYFPDAGSDLEDVTFGEVYDVVRAAAAGLQELGLERGDGGAILSENCWEWAIVDFACLEKNLVIELDGGQHAEHAVYDAERSAWLEGRGFRVLRFWNNEVFGEIKAVKEAIWQALC